MTEAQFNAAYRAFCRRQPFRAFLIEFTSGVQMPVSHPEAVRNEAELYMMRRPDSGFVLFAAESVSRLLDVSTPAAQ